MSTLSPRLWAIPVVRNSDERDGLFPNPATFQRVHNLATGTIQIWNGASWSDVFFSGSLSTGTPSVFANGVQVLAQPQIIDFVGRVSGTPAGTTAQINLPALAADNTLGTVVGEPTAFKFIGAGVSVVAGTGPDAGKAIVAIAASGAGIYRSDVLLTTDPLNKDEVGTGTVELGALSTLVKTVASGKAWLRLYSTAADRTADAGRAITADPTTPIVLDVIFDPTLSVTLYPIVLAANLDAPVANVLYYSVTQLQDTSGPFVNVAVDNLTVPIPSGDTDMVGRAPTNPGATGWALWEMEAASFYIREVYGGAMAYSGAGSAKVARTDVDFNHDKLKITMDVYHHGVFSDTAANAAFHVPATAMGTWAYDDYIAVGLATTGDNATGEIVHIEAGGGPTVLASTAPNAISFPRSSGLRIEASVVDGVAILVVSDYHTGANPVTLLSAAVPAAVIANQRIGFNTSNTGLNSAGYALEDFTVDEGSVAPGAVDITITRDLMETA